MEECLCGAPVLDSHLTCGKVECGTQAEAEARRRDGGEARKRGFEGAARLLRGECVLCGSAAHRTSACPEIGRD